MFSATESLRLHAFLFPGHWDAWQPEYEALSNSRMPRGWHFEGGNPTETHAASWMRLDHPQSHRTGSRKESHCETELRLETLHPPRDFSQRASLPQLHGNSLDNSKSYFLKPVGSSNPRWSATKLILQEKIRNAKLCRDFRRLADKLARVGQ
jgi:hypothetical protein